MKILAIESSGVVASCAVFSKEGVLANSSVATGLTHSETLMTLVDCMFENANIDVKEIDVVAASIGPGSFTGLRIGIAAAKGIALGLGVPFIGVNSLKSFAYSFLGNNCYVCPCVDARSDRVYYALFEINNFNVKMVMEDKVKEIADLRNILTKKWDKKIVLTANAAENVFESLVDVENIVVAPKHLIHQNAVNIALAAQDEIKDNGLTEKEFFVNYLVPSQAERNLNKKLKFKGEKQI